MMEQEDRKPTLAEKVKRLKLIEGERGLIRGDKVKLDNRDSTLVREADALRKSIAGDVLSLDRDLAYVIGRAHPDIEAKYKKEQAK